MISQQNIQEACQKLVLPHHPALGAAHFSAEGSGNHWHLTLTLPYLCEAEGELGEQALRASVLQQLASCLPDQQLTLTVVHAIAAHAVKVGVARLANIKNIIAVASAKGGVGKSTTAVNLALALVKGGAKVGLLDADIYGPSVPLMLGLQGVTPIVTADKKFIPLEKYGLKVMSIGLLVSDEKAMIWRGPMASQAFNQLISDTAWGELDYLVVDMPPGTGDIQLTLSQKVPVTGVVMVTTPQDLALADVRKGVAMFEKVDLPILGMVENMSTHICSACQHEEAIFGTGGAQKMAAQLGLNILAEMPLALQIRSDIDHGCPTVAQTMPTIFAQKYQLMARQVALLIAAKPKDYASKLSSIPIKKI